MPRSATPASRLRAARRVGAAVLAACLVPSVSACSGDDDEKKPAGGEQSSAAPAAPGVATETVVGETAGRIPPAGRRAAARQVARAVDVWWDAAYLGEFPRSSVGDAFRVFTKPAAARARRNTGLLSNVPAGRGLTGVEAVKRRVAVDLLAVKRRPVAATARVDLVMRLSGEGADRRVRVSGRVLLTRERGAWRIFGYDLRREMVK